MPTNTCIPPSFLENTPVRPRGIPTPKSLSQLAKYNAIRLKEDFFSSNLQNVNSLNISAGNPYSKGKLSTAWKDSLFYKQRKNIVSVVKAADLNYLAQGGQSC
jgi:hypothetical protein